MSDRRRWIAALSAVVATSTCVMSPAASAAPAWRLASMPETRATSNLWDVAAVDARHAWAVGLEGYHPDQQQTAGGPMILRWNGTRWSRGSLPAVQGRVSFKRVAATSPTDVWVLGTQGVGDVSYLLWRYNGRTWTEVPYPAGATPGSVSIQDMSVVDGHVWLVGYRGSRSVLHEWNGQEWREHQPPAECMNNGFPNFCTFNAVKAFAADDIWAAGNGMWNGFMGPLLFHWNGSAWRAVQVGINQQPLSFKSIDGRSSKEIWAVGDTGGQGSGTLVVRGDGTTWEQVGGLTAPLLQGVAVGANGAPWVIGNLPPQSSSAFNTYRAGAWASTPAPAPANTLGTWNNAIAAVPGTDRILAVGAADLPDTNPRLVRAVIAEYGPRP